MPGVAIDGSVTSVCAWVLVAALGRVFLRPGDWMTALCLDARLIVGRLGGWRPVAGPVVTVPGARLGTLGRELCTALVLGACTETRVRAV